MDSPPVSHLTTDPYPDIVGDSSLIMVKADGGASGISPQHQKKSISTVALLL